MGSSGDTIPQKRSNKALTTLKPYVVQAFVPDGVAVIVLYIYYNQTRQEFGTLAFGSMILLLNIVALALAFRYPTYTEIPRTPYPEIPRGVETSRIRAGDRKNLNEMLTLIQEYVNLVIEEYPSSAPRWQGARPIEEEWAAVKSVFAEASNTFASRQHWTFHEALNDHGLSGKQLRHKVIYLKRAGIGVKTAVARHHLNASTLSWLVGVLTNLLDSLSPVFPPFGAVKEFLEQVRSNIDWLAKK